MMRRWAGLRVRVREILAVFLAAIISLSTAPPAEGLSGESEPPAEEEFLPHAIARRRAVCGANSLYMLLRISGIETSYEQVVSALGGETKIRGGVSLAELHKASRALGLSTTPRKCSLKDLRRRRFPLIAYSHFGLIAITSDVKKLGHYVVVLSAAVDEVRYIDGTTGAIHTDSYEDFEFVRWSGYILEVEKKPQDSFKNFGWIATTICALVAVLLLRTGRKGARVGEAALVAVCLVGAAVANMVEPGPARASAAAEVEGDMIWRRLENDAANSLYLLCHLQGHQVSYADVREHFGTGAQWTTAQQLRDAASELGLPVGIVRSNPNLLLGQSPMIAHLKDPRSDTGEFVLLVSVTEKQVYLVHGGYVIFERLPIDEFRRRWSGYLLVVDGPPQTLSSPLAWVPLFLIAGVVYWGFRSRYTIDRANSTPGISPD